MPLRHRCAGASPCRTRKRDNGMPQRQGIAGNAAVVEGERRRDTVQKACRGGSAERAAPQRQGITGNAAVVEGERRRDTVQKACRGGSAERAAPQRQGITGNAAVVEGERRRDTVQKAYSRMTVTSRAPWAPMTRACSMSAVLEGPAMKLPKS